MKPRPTDLGSATSVPTPLDPAPVASAAAVPAKTRRAVKPKTAVVKPFAFSEDPPETTDRLRPVYRRPEKRNEVIVTRQADRFRALPAHGPNQIRIVTAGSRVNLIPSDQQAAIHLAGLRAQVGTHYDAKRSANVQWLDEMLGRGASGFDSILLLARLNGLVIDESGVGSEQVEGYRRALRRQKSPIPRVVWRDESEKVTGEITGEVSLDRKSWGRS